MINKIQVKLVYDGSSQGNTDKSALQSACTTELAKGTAVASVTHGSNTETSGVSVSGQTLTFLIFYTDSTGDADCASFWSTLQTEYAKSTVTKGALASSGNTHKCGHNSGQACMSFSYLS